MRQIRNQRTNRDANRPFDAFNVPATFADPGPDGRAGTGDDGSPINGFNLQSSATGLPTLTTVANQPDARGDYYTWEVSGNRRMSGRWSLRASFTHTWNIDHGNSYAGSTVRQYSLPFTPNDLINTDREDGAYKFTNWTAKFMSTIEAPYGIRLTPMLRHQSGDQIGRIVQVGFNYGTQPVWSSRSRRTGWTTPRSGICERRRCFASAAARSHGFMDLYNIANSNAEFRQIYTSGSSFGFPTTIIPPRIIRFGAKLKRVLR